MSYLALLADALPKALDAVTGQIQTYFSKDNLTKLLQSQFLFPTVAFVLGCLGLVMAIAGPDLYSVWWNNLPQEVRWLVMGLAVLLFGLLLQISKSLVLKVRQLYSQGWPKWGWWLSLLRKPFLEEYQAISIEQKLLGQAWSDLTQALGILAGLRRGVGPAPGEKRIEKARYPVLKVPVSAYQLIGGPDWEWAELDAVLGQDMVQAPEDLVGHYPSESLPAGQVIPKTKLRVIHDTAYLDATGKRVLALSVYRTETGPHLEAGAMVTLWLTPRRGWGKPRSFENLLVLDRPTPGEIVLSVPGDQVDEILALLPDSHQRILRSPRPPQPKRVAIPVVKLAEGLRPGQLVEEQHVHWRTPAGNEADLKGVATRQDDVVGKVYWPKKLEDGPGPDELGPVLGHNKPFKTKDLARVPQKSWFTYPDPASGKDKYRLGYRLPIPTGPTTRAGYWAITDQRVSVVLLADGDPDPPPSRQQFTIRRGDRVTVMVDQKVEQKWCYVYQVDTQRQCIYIAVIEPATFKKIEQGNLVESTPFCPVPVLKQARQPRQLIAESHLTTQWLHGNAKPVQTVCLEKAQVLDHYVAVNRPLPADEPVPVGAVRPARPAGSTYFAFDSAQAGSGAIHLGSANVPKRGDLVSIKVSSADTEARTIPWAGAFVGEDLTVDPGGKALKLKVTIPAAEEVLVDQLWKAGATVTATVTHCDATVESDLSSLAEEIRVAEELAPLNRTLSVKDPREESLAARAKAMRDWARGLDRLRVSMRDRPWEGDAPPSPSFARSTEDQARKLVWRLYDTVEIWLQAVDRIKEDRARGAKLALPATMANTRPTELGNVLAAAADYPSTAYDIDVASILPRLIQVLGEEDTRLLRLTNAEATMDMLLLFSFWAGVWTIGGLASLLALSGPWWVYLVVAIGGPGLWWLAKGAATTQAYVYGDELKALIDLKRRKLLTALGFDLPEAMTPEEEKKYWHYLYRLFAYGTTTDDFPKLKLGDGGKGG